MELVKVRAGEGAVAAAGTRTPALVLTQLLISRAGNEALYASQQEVRTSVCVDAVDTGGRAGRHGHATGMTWHNQ